MIPALGQMDDVAVLFMLAYYWYTLTKPAPAARGGSGPVIDIRAEEVR